MDNGMNNAGNSMGTFFLGLAVGAIVGGVTALLLAPQPGTDTRTMLKDRFSRMRDMVRSRAQEAAEKVDKMSEETQ
jgi:gas vesicle protein